MEDLTFSSLTELSRKLQAREVSAVELARHYLDRIEAHRDLNAFLDVRPEATLAEAREADERIAAGNAGPLTVVTTFSKNRIEKIEIKTSNDTSYVGGVAMEKVRNEILSKQHLGVDTVSGATMSSAALLRAVGEAAEKAGVSAESLVPHKKPVDPAALPAEKFTTDVVVIGAGGTGLAAAATAAEKGAKVRLTW